MTVGYKPYSTQVRECKKSGQQFEVPCIMCDQINLICHKYRAYCSSNLCRDERMDIALKAEFYADRLKEQKCKKTKNKTTTS
jgi:hypothetical protein